MAYYVIARRFINGVYKNPTTFGHFLNDTYNNVVDAAQAISDQVLNLIEGVDLYFGKYRDQPDGQTEYSFSWSCDAAEPEEIAYYMGWSLTKVGEDDTFIEFRIVPANYLDKTQEIADKLCNDTLSMIYGKRFDNIDNIEDDEVMNDDWEYLNEKILEIIGRRFLPITPKYKPMSAIED